jgi:tetratricopeptide (TPR) repeat protein
VTQTHRTLKLTDKQPPSSWLTVAVCLSLTAIVWAVFGQTTHYSFVNYDDPVCIYKNPAITQGLSWHGAVWVFQHGSFEAWYPLTDISHQLDWQLYGPNAGGHHLTNVLLHAAAAVMLFLALRRLTGAFWRAAFAAAVFAIHPLRAESVAWAIERKDVLSGLFFMLTLWAWAGHLKKRARINEPDMGACDPNFVPAPSGWTADYFLALIFFLFGLLSKTMLVTLPFVLLLLDFWPLNRLPSGAPCPPRRWLKAWTVLIWEKVPFLVLSICFCVATVLTQHGVVTLGQHLTIFWRIGNSLQAFADYLGHMIYPVGLTVVYSDSGINPSLGRAGVAAFILLAITVGAWFGRKKHPYLIVGWLWYLGMLLPAVDLMQLSHNARADRYTYLPQIGLSILLAWGATELGGILRCRRVVLAVAAVAIIGALSVCAYIQTTYWQDSITLWTRSIACTPANAYAQNGLGSALSDEGKWTEAIPHLKTALRIRPDYPDALVNLGVALVNLDRREEAIPYYERALQINPYSSEAHYNLGDALAAQGKIPEAIQHFEQALKSEPDHAGAHYDLGLYLGIEGKWDEAIPHFEQSFRFKVDQADARYITGVALATQKKWAEAIRLYQQAIQLKPALAEARYRLGIALSAQHKWPEALESFHQALALATSQGDAALAESINAEIKSCKTAEMAPPAP